MNKPAIKEEKIQRLLFFIEQEWEKTVRSTPEDKGDLIGLPFPYTVPAITAFQEMYYWDTYFTNIGLLRQARFNLAKNNVENFLYLVDRFGFVPNGTRTTYLSRSQPPYLSTMIRDIYSVTRDRDWLSHAVGLLTREYSKFWTQKPRFTWTGLSRHFDSSEKNYLGILNLAQAAECESGWDFNPRFGDARNCNPIDLNSLLFKYEIDLAWFYQELQRDTENKEWQQKGRQRQGLVNHYCWDKKEKFYYDYDFVKKERRPVRSLAAFSPLWAGLATDEQAAGVAEKLKWFEHDWGLATCARDYGQSRQQWGYPNGWAPLHWIAAIGLKRYGYKKEAERIARKWVGLVNRVFLEKGELWEKYNVVEGNIHVADGHYKMPQMRGWTSGVTVALAYDFNLVDGV